MTDDSDSETPTSEGSEIARFEPFARAVLETWTKKGAVEVDGANEEQFVADLMRRAADAETPYKMLKALAKEVENSEYVEEYYASREELIDMIRSLANE